MPRRLVSWKELRERFGIPYSRTHVGRLENGGKFPKRLALGECRVAWYEDEIEAWIESRPRA
jgi:prophage regulatory protein